MVSQAALDRARQSDHRSPCRSISLSAVESLGDALRDVRPIAVNVDVVSSCDERPRDVAEQVLTLRVDPLRGL
jgi:hypothetical protein